MFKTLDEMIRFNRSQIQLAWDAVVRAVSGIVLTLAGFGAIYSLAFALE